MRALHYLTMAIFFFAVSLSAKKVESVEQKLQWARETIDAHAVTHHFEPPARSSGTKWHVSRIAGCAMELKESTHRESLDSVIIADDVFGLSEDKVVIWTFDLANLLPQFIAAGTLDGPHVEIVSQGDTFHFNTEVVLRTLRKDGTMVNTSNWSAPGTAQNFRIYFDSPGADNSSLVQRLAHDLREAVNRCAMEANAADHQRWK